MLNSQKERLQRLLIEAAEKNDSETAKYFIEKRGVPATITDNRDRTLVHIFTGHDNLDMVKYIVEKCPSLLTTPGKQYVRSVLQLAVRRGALGIVKYLVDAYQKDTISNPKESDLENIMPFVVEFDRLDILKYFVDEKKVNINMPGKWQNQPPIFVAVEFGHHDMVKYLVEGKKANVTARDWIGENILYVAVRRDDFTIMKYVLDEKKIDFNLNSTNKLGETLVHVAASLNRINILEYLVDQKNVDIGIRDKENNMTALHSAALANHYDACKCLLERGANPGVRDSSGKIPAEKTRDSGLRELLQPNPEKRNRRSVHGSYAASKVLSEAALTATADRLKGDTSPFYGDRSAFSSQLQNFLLVGTSFMREVKKFAYRPLRDVSPTPEHLRKRMDTMAIGAIDALPNFDASLQRNRLRWWRE